MLNGYKTYLISLIIIALSALLMFDAIDFDEVKALLVLLIGGGFASLRKSIEKK